MWPCSELCSWSDLCMWWTEHCSWLSVHRSKLTAFHSSEQSPTWIGGKMNIEVEKLQWKSRELRAKESIALSGRRDSVLLLHIFPLISVFWSLLSSWLWLYGFSFLLLFFLASGNRQIPKPRDSSCVSFLLVWKCRSSALCLISKQH